MKSSGTRLISIFFLTAFALINTSCGGKSFTAQIKTSAGTCDISSNAGAAFTATGDCLPGGAGCSIAAVIGGPQQSVCPASSSGAPASPPSPSGWCSVIVGVQSGSNCSPSPSGGASSPPSSSAPTNISGTYTGPVHDSTGQQAGSAGTLTLNITQNGTQLTGSWTEQYPNNPSASGTLAGSLNGTAVTLTMSYDAATQAAFAGPCTGSSLTGSISGTSLTGSDSDVPATVALCSAVSETFTLTKQ